MRGLGVLVHDHGEKLRRFNDRILRAMGKAGGQAAAGLAAKDPFTRRVYESHMKFGEAGIARADISERAHLNARSLGFPYGT